MKAVELMLLIGEAKPEYVLEADEPVKVTRISRKKVLLIAALVAAALLLTGCVAVTILRMQDRKVGEYDFTIPTAYDEDGNLLPTEYQEPLTLLSIQGTNMEALSEWLAFKNSYDPDHTIMTEADLRMKSGNPWPIPDNYRYTYDCYSPEMMDKLNEIVEKYDLRLLSAEINVDYRTSSVLRDALSIGYILYPDLGSEVEYVEGGFYVEGSFAQLLKMNYQGKGWSYEDGYVQFRYSLKEYFDPATDNMLESQDYSQWEYARKDGKKVLLVLNEETASVYADLSNASIFISLNPVILVDGAEVPMTKEALETLAEGFDLAIKPIPTTMERVEAIQAEVQTKLDAEDAAAQMEWEAKYNSSDYAEFVQARLEKERFSESLSYIQMDINGDGVEELIIAGREILSMKDGKTYPYFILNDPQKSGVDFGRFQPCEENVFELWSDLFPYHQYYFYEAGAESATFLTGVIHDTETDTWYRSLHGGRWDTDREQISTEEAQAIRNSYTRLPKVEWLPLKQYGKPIPKLNYSDPYATYIAKALYRYEAATEYRYVLMDLDGNGVQELITREVVPQSPQSIERLRIQTIKNGNILDIDGNRFSHICEGNIVEETDNKGRHFAYYRYTPDGVVIIEKVFQDPSTGYWSIVRDGKGQNVREETAKEVINSYKWLELDWKPITEYPMN